MSSTTPDVFYDEWFFCAGYLAPVREDGSQRTHDLRRVLDTLLFHRPHWCALALAPGDFLPRPAVEQLAERWSAAGVFVLVARDHQYILHGLDGPHVDPTAAILDSPTLPSTPASGSWVGWYGAKRCIGSRVLAAVDTLGHLLGVVATPSRHVRAGRALG